MRPVTLGRMTVQKVFEMESGPPMPLILPGITAQDLRRLAAWYRDETLGPTPEQSAFTMSMHSYVLQLDGLTVLIDACNGEHKRRSIPDVDRVETPFLANLATLGLTTNDIDLVLCTHLHFDHVGWNTRLENGKWVPTFPNARYLIGRTEYDHWRDAQEGETVEIMNDSVEPIFDAGLAQTVAMDHRVSPEIRLVPTPGHTPGHVSVMIESRGETAIITGDMIHHPCQFGRPDWLSMFDADQGAANARRHTMFNEWADKPWLIIGTHFAAPTAGHIKRDGAGYRFEA